MPLELVIIGGSVAVLIAFGLGYFIRFLVGLGQKSGIELKIKEQLLNAEDEAKKIVKEAEQKADTLLSDTRNEIREQTEKLKGTEDRLIKKEERLDKRQSDIEKEVDTIKEKLEEIRVAKEEIERLNTEKQKELQTVAGLSKEEAKAILLSEVEKEHEEDMLVRMRKLETEGTKRLEDKAKDILVSAIHRYGNAVDSDVMSTSVTLPSDDIKGKIIGKEGRNIKAFEKATGVEVVIDDTPGSIILSSFDPVRRAVAKLTLENLIKDGRIQPAKIEEEAEKARNDVNKIIKEKGEQAAYETGVFGLDERILSILGRLHFRTSYGQNVLQHSIEMAHIAGLLAEELGANVAIAKAGALLHDIGKAVDHEIQGTHVEIGRRILQKFGADEEIVKAMQAHHEEYPYETIESVIVQVADSISGSRPGARRDTVENYLKRLADLEAVANSFEGADKSFALQAGREIRVLVKAEAISDLDAKKLAREIAKKVEQELKYPGEIKVNVIRELRVTEYAR